VDFLGNQDEGLFSRFGVVDRGTMNKRQTSLYCTLQIIRFFYKLQVCGNPALSKLIGAIFPTEESKLLHFVKRKTPFC
ncbi:hypothetical protein ABN148_27620, partial [Klebsiella oxytoca]|uniref:hypothetical protein n=1 Tax=Klebsiella oxytoca TaxID=571 RepID=UPI0032D9DD12